MKKPSQTLKFAKNPDNDTLLDELENAMSSIVDAMEYLRGYEQFADWFDTLDDMFSEMEPEREQYEIAASIDYSNEIAALNRDYLRSVL